MKILSLFDGMSCGQIAINNLGVTNYTYYASEIDKYAIKVAKHNYPNIIHIGDVTKINGSDYLDIDLLIGGSPCQGFSFAGKQLNFEDERSKLFFEYVRILKETKPKYFLLENVKMKKEYQDIISSHLGVQPIEINSALVSAQNRKRLYWVGIRQDNGSYITVNIPQPQDKGIFIKDIIEQEVDEKFYISEELYEKLKKFESNSRYSEIDGKSYTLSTMQGGHRQPKILERPHGYNQGQIFETKSPTLRRTSEGNTLVMVGYALSSREFKATGWKNDKSPTLLARDYKDPKVVKYNSRIRKLTPLECERLQTVPDNYTNIVSNSQRYKMLGNGWTVDVITHILNYLIYE